jgi:hypothetical protein
VEGEQRGKERGEREKQGKCNEGKGGRGAEKQPPEVWIPRKLGYK